MRAKYPQRWRPRYDSILLYMLKHPAARLYEVAAATGYTRWHLSRIVNSPEFRRRYRDYIHAAASDAAVRFVTRQK